MSKYECPLCGGKVIRNEIFCRSCQASAKKTNSVIFEKVVVQEEIKHQNVEVVEEAKINDDPIENGDNNINIIGIRPEKRNSFVYIFLVALLICAVGSAYFYNAEMVSKEEKEFWSQSIDGNTSLSYAQYLHKYPKGEYSIVAESKIREIQILEMERWNEVKNSMDISALLSFSKEYPNTPYISKVRSRVDMLAWEKALKENNAESYKSYIENVKLNNYAGSYASLAQERYEYYNSLTIVEGEERTRMLKYLTKALNHIGERKISNISKLLSASNVSFFRIKGLDKTALLDSLTSLYKVEDEFLLSTKYTIIEPQTSIVKDRNNIYQVMTSVVGKISFKDKKKKGITDTLNFEMLIDDSLKITRMELLTKK